MSFMLECLVIYSHLQYEAKIKDLEQQLIAVASEKQRLANELNRATDSRVRELSTASDAAFATSKPKTVEFGGQDTKDIYMGQFCKWLRR